MDDLEQFLFSPADMSDPNEVDEAPARFIRLYILADQLGDCASANMITGALINYVGDDNWICNAHICLAFEHTSESSPLRSFLVDKLAYDCMPETAAEMLRDDAILMAAIGGAWLRLTETIVE